MIQAEMVSSTPLPKERDVTYKGMRVGKQKKRKREAGKHETLKLGCYIWVTILYEKQHHRRGQETLALHKLEIFL